MRIAIVAVLLSACGSTPPKPVETPPVPAPAPVPVVAMKPPAPPKHAWPETKAGTTVDQLHDVPVKDPYRWLEDEHAADVQAWMKEEDDYARGELAKLPGRAELAARMKELLYYDALGAPVHHGGRYFFSRKHADKEKTIVYWKQGEKGADKVLFDPNQWSEDGSKGLHGWSPSYDGKHVAYAVSEHNSDETVIHVIDVATGKDTPDIIPGTKYAAASWTPDGKGFYYTWVPEVDGKTVTIADRPGFAELRFHALGTEVAKDPVIREATRDSGTFMSGFISRDGHWLVSIIQHGWNSSDIYFKDARAAGGKWQTLVAGAPSVFNIDVWRDRFYIHTNDGAPRYRVFEVDPKKPARDAWKEIVAQNDATLEAVTILGEHMVLTYLTNATSKIEIRDLHGKPSHDVAVPPLGTVGGLAGNPDEDTAYASYTSFTEPQVIYKFSVKSGKTDEYARVKIPVDTSKMVTEQVFFPSKDGTKISMFLIHGKDAKPDGKAPTILYGYGGFNVSMTPGFAGSRSVWIEHGGVYAIPNLRGGGEYGEDWHKAGMLLAKQNVFDDYIAAAEYLISSGWTSKQHLSISGGSNGGLLVGAALTQRPDLFKAVICAVPLLDMLRYHLYGSGKTWVPEYGSAEDAEQFKVLWGYSPYRRAIDGGAKAYPAVLFDSADHDDRVDPMHARKLAAALQADQTADAPILLRIERNAGHGGADMVKQQVERAADQLAFLLHQLK